SELTLAPAPSLAAGKAAPGPLSTESAPNLIGETPAFFAAVSIEDQHSSIVVRSIGEGRTTAPLPDSSTAPCCTASAAKSSPASLRASSRRALAEPARAVGLASGAAASSGLACFVAGAGAVLGIVVEDGRTAADDDRAG